MLLRRKIKHAIPGMQLPVLDFAVHYDPTSLSDLQSGCAMSVQADSACCVMLGGEFRVSGLIAALARVQAGVAEALGHRAQVGRQGQDRRQRTQGRQRRVKCCWKRKLLMNDNSSQMC